MFIELQVIILLHLISRINCIIKFNCTNFLLFIFSPIIQKLASFTLKISINDNDIVNTMSSLLYHVFPNDTQRRNQKYNLEWANIDYIYK